MVHSTDIIELELKSKKYTLSLKKKEALHVAQPVVQVGLLHAPHHASHGAAHYLGMLFSFYFFQHTAFSAHLADHAYAPYMHPFPIFPILL